MKYVYYDFFVIVRGGGKGKGNSSVALFRLREEAGTYLLGPGMSAGTQEYVNLHRIYYKRNMIHLCFSDKHLMHKPNEGFGLLASSAA